MSVTFSHAAYRGNDGTVLSGRESLANGFAFVRNHANPKANIATYLQAQNFANKTIQTNKSIEEQLRARKIFLFSIFVLETQPNPLFEGQTMRSATQDFGSWNSIIVIIEEEEEDEEDGEEAKAKDEAVPNFNLVDFYPALFRSA